MTKFEFETAGIYYSRIFDDVAVVWKKMSENDNAIWNEQGRPSDFVATSRQINIGRTLGM